MHDGVEKEFYVSNYVGKAYLGCGTAAGSNWTTEAAYIICAKFLDVWTITFDLNGGTAPEGVDYKPVQKEKWQSHPTPVGPLKPGYYCWGWKEKDGTKE